MLRKTKSRGSLRALRGQTLLRMPVMLPKRSEWESAICERISEEVDARSDKTWGEDARYHARKIIIERFFPDKEELLLFALAMQVELYAEKANNEVGFDIGLEAHHVVVDEAERPKLLFATMKSASRERLLGIDDVERRFDNLSRARRELYRAGGRRVLVAKADVYGDLLLCASANTANSIGSMPPKKLLNNVIESRLSAVDLKEFLAFFAPDTVLSGPH